MEEENKSTSYGNIFKTTFLFGFVQLFKAVISIIKNKLVAILIGPEGMGLLGIFNSTIQVIQTGAGLGVNQSAVRDIAEANGENDKLKVSRIISITNRVVLYTGAIGCMITLILSKKISEWTLGDTEHTISYCVLSLVVILNIINEGKQSILKGMRRLRHLAYASLIGTSVSLFTAITLYYFFGTKGIVPELLIAAIIAVIVSQWFVRKIPVLNVKLSFRQIIQGATPMVKMGVALMFVTFLGTAVSFAVNAYIRQKGGLIDVGFFSAGSYILSGYFGIIVTALTTDYYPRIAAVNQDNEKLQDELNKQSLATVVLCCPLIVIFIALMPLFIRILYSDDFLPALDYLKFGIYWTIITLCSNQVDMILVAKYNTKAFMLISVLIRTIQLVMCIGLYEIWGLFGLGVSYALLGLLHLIIMTTIVWRLYNIHFSMDFVRVAIVALALTISSSLVAIIDNDIIKYGLACILIIISVYFSNFKIKSILGINIITVIKNKFIRK